MVSRPAKAGRKSNHEAAGKGGRQGDWPEARGGLKRMSENLSPGFVIQTGVTMGCGAHARKDGTGMRGQQTRPNRRLKNVRSGRVENTHPASSNAGRLIQ